MFYYRLLTRVRAIHGRRRTVADFLLARASASATGIGPRAMRVSRLSSNEFEDQEVGAIGVVEAVSRRCADD
jgi:hypothetical protein